MTKEESECLTRMEVMRCRARIDETLNEMACQNLDAASHALLDQVRQRLHEDLAMMVGVQLVGHASR